MKKYISLLVPALLVAAGACHKKAAEEGAALPTIDVAVPEVRDVTLTKSYPAVVKASKEVDLVARVNGYLTGKVYDSGDFVKKGTVLFTIEDRNYRDAVEQAQASLTEATATRQYAASRYAAMKEALKGDAVSEMEVAQAKSNLETAEAAIATATAALQTARTQLSYCTVYAPFDGHVSAANYNVGAYLAGEGAPVVLATIYHDSKMYAEFSIEDASYLGKLRGYMAENPSAFDSIRVVFSEKLPHSYTACLDYLDPSIDTSTGTMTLQGSIANPYGDLRTGMYATVVLPFGKADDAVLVKDAAISSDQLGKYIYLVNDSGRVETAHIRTGELVDDSMRIVESGIGPNDRYVTKALLKVRDGMEVKPRLTR